MNPEFINVTQKSGSKIILNKAFIFEIYSTRTGTQTTYKGHSFLKSIEVKEGIGDLWVMLNYDDK